MIQSFTIPQRVDTNTLKDIAQKLTGAYFIIYTKESDFQWTDFGQERMLQVAVDTGAVLVYADHFASMNGKLCSAPVIDYQIGSLRDDFDFGGVLFIESSAFRKTVQEMDINYCYAGLYDLRLRLSRLGSFVRIPEFLYSELEVDTRKSGEKIFDYVDPRNREVQVEMEKACTEHLKAIGAYLEPVFKSVNLGAGDFVYEASVVIPCRNRVKTIADAVHSALNQKTNFKYNVIVVDDHSNDGTIELLDSIKDSKLIVVRQPDGHHLIGGNWNAAIHHPLCGRFALQLDSDDMYSDDTTIQRFVDAFYSSGCPAVIGTYRITDFSLNTLPPGIIDHKEWTAENGRNNALRINGLGAPRGFYTPLLRSINFPVVKYGEDYAVMLRIGREYQIARVWEVLYNCRRWDDNSDAALDIEKINNNNLYKDRLRSWEILARISKNTQ